MMQVNLNRITRLVTDKHEHHSRKYIRISTLNASGRDNDSLSLTHTQKSMIGGDGRNFLITKTQLLRGVNTE